MLFFYVARSFHVFYSSVGRETLPSYSVVCLCCVFFAALFRRFSSASIVRVSAKVSLCADSLLVVFIVSFRSPSIIRRGKWKVLAMGCIYTKDNFTGVWVSLGGALVTSFHLIRSVSFNEYSVGQAMGSCPSLSAQWGGFLLSPSRELGSQLRILCVMVFFANCFTNFEVRVSCKAEAPFFRVFFR